MTGIVTLVAALAAATTLGLVLQVRRGRVSAPGRRADAVLTGADIGGELGERATLVQFSSAFCAPCRATRRILSDVAGLVDGVRHVEVDAEAHLELVRRVGVVSTPTTLVLDPHGRVVRRAVGQPRKAEVVAALGELA